MYSSVSKGIALLFYITFTLPIPIANAAEHPVTVDEIQFKMQPQQCVTLRQGRACFATITVQWQKNTPQSVCLYQHNKQQLGNKQPLHCWKSDRQGLTTIEFQSTQSLTYQLRAQESNTLLAETEVMVGWLHKNTNRRRHWRLF